MAAENKLIIPFSTHYVYEYEMLVLWGILWDDDDFN